MAKLALHKASAIDDALIDRVRTYYLETQTSNYIPRWARDFLRTVVEGAPVPESESEDVARLVATLKQPISKENTHISAADRAVMQRYVKTYCSQSHSPNTLGSPMVSNDTPPDFSAGAAARRASWPRLHVVTMRRIYLRTRLNRKIINAAILQVIDEALSDINSFEVRLGTADKPIVIAVASDADCKSAERAIFSVRGDDGFLAPRDVIEFVVDTAVARRLVEEGGIVTSGFPTS